MTRPTDEQDEYLWKYDPVENEVHIEPGEADHPADFPTFETMAQHVHHPDKMQGYAFPIEDGYRITDDMGKKVEDPYIIKQIVLALNKENPPKPLPHVRYHGDPEPFDYSPMAEEPLDPEHYGSHIP